MTVKQQVEELCHRLHCEIDVVYDTRDARRIDIIQIESPEGKNFDNELHYLNCIDWDDALQRLSTVEILDCNKDCDCLI